MKKKIKIKTQNKCQNPDILFKVLNLIHKQPKITQRELANSVGISLGSVHYCIRALVSIGWVKIENFKRNPNKLNYLYLLTPEGVLKKSNLAYEFLHRKINEYVALKKEIDLLRKEIR